MANLSAQDIDAIAKKIAADLRGQTPAAPASTPASAPPPSPGEGIFSSINEAVAAAKKAQPIFQDLPMATRNKIIAAMRQTMREHSTALAKAAFEETRLGRFEDKIAKNALAIEKTPGTEDLQPVCYTGDRGLTLVELAPFGVIGAITPTTNPTSTIICNSIGMLAAGNSVVFNVHPRSKNVSVDTVKLLNRAIMDAGGPPNVITCINVPTVQSAQELMVHPDTRLLVVTGGGAVVKAAMQSGKRAICAGPGNPPVVVDETADIEQAGRDIVRGASTDNNIICLDEKECVVVEKVADALLESMARHGATIIDKGRLADLERVIFTKMHGPREHAEINRDLVGINAGTILAKMGIQVPSTTRLGVIEVTEDHPLLWTEQMMPILPVVRVPNADYAIKLAVALEGGCQHSTIMHSKNIDNLSRMARACNCSIFVKNGPAVSGIGLGGEGYTTFTIASPTGEGLTGPRSFSRSRRCVMVDHFRIV